MRSGTDSGPVSGVLFQDAHLCSETVNVTK
jgi:hypothetical protein